MAIPRFYLACARQKQKKKGVCPFAWADVGHPAFIFLKMELYGRHAGKKPEALLKAIGVGPELGDSRTEGGQQVKLRHSLS